MAFVNITVTNNPTGHKPKGLDTKYLFPGLEFHNNESVSGPAANGLLTYFDNVPHGHSGTQFRYITLPAPFFTVTKGGTDFNADLDSWVVGKANATTSLASLSIVDDAGNYQRVNIASFGAVTPDSLVTALQNAHQFNQLRFLGGDGNDTLRGSFADDQFDGGKGADVMIGGGGDDTYLINSARDKIAETAGSGNDGAFTTVSYTLPRNVETLVALVPHRLSLTGNGSGNYVVGNGRSDTIHGLGGDDFLAGYGGKDVIYGGKGRDQFFFTEAPSKSTVDTIKDFKHSADTIMLGQIAMPGLEPSTVPNSTPLTDAQFWASKSGKAHDLDDRILYDTDNHRLYFDPDGAGAEHRQLLARFNAGAHLHVDDFLVI